MELTFPRTGQVRIACEPMSEIYSQRYDREGLRIGELICRRTRDRAVVSESASRWEIVFVRRGAFTIEMAGRMWLATANQMLFLAPGRPYRISHPTSLGDHCTVAAIESARFTEWMERLEVSDELSRSLFARVCILVPATAYLAQDALLAAGDDAEGFVIDTLGTAIGTVAAPGTCGRGDAIRLDSRHRRIVQDVQERIVLELAWSTPLAAIARDAGVSMFYLSRLFRSHTGCTIHQYRIRTRLREAFARLRQGESDLTMLALDLGFSDHSHFTNAFRREFGAAPSTWRSLLLR